MVRVCTCATGEVQLTAPVTPERIAELRELARRHTWNVVGDNSALRACIVELLDEVERLQRERDEAKCRHSDAVMAVTSEKMYASLKADNARLRAVADAARRYRWARLHERVRAEIELDVVLVALDEGDAKP